MSEPQPIAGNVARMRRYRAKHRRIDYVPADDILEIIEAHLAHGLSNCLAGVIDVLVKAGHEALKRK